MLDIGNHPRNEVQYNVFNKSMHSSREAELIIVINPKVENSFQLELIQYSLDISRPDLSLVSHFRTKTD